MIPTPVTDRLAADLGTAQLIVPADQLRAWLHGAGFTLSQAGLRQWVHRGFVARHPGGFDLIEVARLVERHAQVGKLTKAARTVTLSAREACPQVAESEAA